MLISVNLKPVFNVNVTHTYSTSYANSASFPQRDGK